MDGNDSVTLYRYDDLHRLTDVYYDYTGVLPPEEGWAYPANADLSCTYTPAGLLDTATYKDKAGNNRTLVNTWDGSSNRVKWLLYGTVDQTLVCDPTAGIPAVLQESFEGYDIYYIREPGGALVARYEAGAGLRYYHFDALGSTRLLTNEDGEVTDRYAYDAWGSLLAHSALSDDPFTGSVRQPYQYVGQLGYYTRWERPGFKLLQLGVRLCDPEIGRFTQRDLLDGDSTATVMLKADPCASWIHKV